MADVLLYHMPPSFYSQVARLVLEEKGVRWDGQIIWAGPPFCESYEPWYMALNPGGTVPTLVHGDQTLPDSRLIIEYVDRAFDGPKLTPTADDERAAMEHWVDISTRSPFES